MKLTRELSEILLSEIHSMTLQEVVEFNKRNWCFKVTDGKLITITIEK